jgi:hypothetical protein
MPQTLEHANKVEAEVQGVSQNAEKVGLTQFLRTNLLTILLLAILTRTLVISLYHGATAPDSGVAGIDFSVYYNAAHRLNCGLPLYQYSSQGFAYVYPPLLAVSLKPLACLSFAKAFKAWFALNTVCFLASVWLYSLASRISLRNGVAVALMLVIGLRFWPTEMSLTFGQPNMILLLLLSGVYFAESRNNFKLSAVLIAAAALIKTWMIGLLIYFVIRRNWRAVFLSLATFCAVLIGSFCAVGTKEFAGFWDLTTNFVTQKSGDHFPSESIIGFARLHLAHNSYVRPIFDSPVLFAVFSAVGIGLILLGLAYAYFTEPKKEVLKPTRNRLVFGLVVLSVMLLSPLLETYYFVFCLPLLWTLLCRPGDRDDRSPRLIFGVQIAAAVVYLLFTRGWPTYIPFAPEYTVGLRSLLTSAELYWALLLWGITMISLVSENRTAPRPGVALADSAGCVQDAIR